MNLAEVYPWLKALHVASALIFVGGVFSAAIFLGAVSSEAIDRSVVRAIRRWDQAVTVPAMLLVWAFGLTLASSGAWLGNGWLSAKLVLVLVLSAIHGVQSGRLRRLEAGAVSHRFSLPPLIAGCVAGIAVLAVLKPF